MNSWMYSDINIHISLSCTTRHGECPRLGCEKLCIEDLEFPCESLNVDVQEWLFSHRFPRFPIRPFRKSLEGQQEGILQSSWKMELNHQFT